jgi:hypothetical protein
MVSRAERTTFSAWSWTVDKLMVASIVLSLAANLS